MRVRGANGSAIPRGRWRAAELRRRHRTRRHLHAAPICYGARHMNTPAQGLAGQSHLEDRGLARSLPGRGLGQGLFLDQRRGPRGDPAEHGRRARRSTCYEVVQGLKARDLHTPVVIRFSDILAHRLRHLADAFAHGHRRERLPQPLRRGVPDQGQPAAPGGRGGLPLRQGIRLRPRGRLQARAARGDVHHRGRAGPHRRVQRLQGRQLHRGGDPRDQARPHHHSRWWRTTRKST